MRTKGIAIEDATTFYEKLTGKIAIENLKPSWMIFNEGFEFSRGLLAGKWILSALISVLLLILFAPVMLVVALFIKLESRGPVFFRQTRVGQEWRHLYTVQVSLHERGRRTGDRTRLVHTG